MFNLQMQTVSGTLMLAQASSSLLLSAFLSTLLVNHGITPVSAKSCKAFWLTLADRHPDVDAHSENCQYDLKHGSLDEIPQTVPSTADDHSASSEIHYNDQYLACYYVNMTSACQKHGKKNWFQEHYIDLQPKLAEGALIGVFCGNKEWRTHPEMLPRNELPGNQVQWKLTNDHICPSNTISVAPTPAYWLEYNSTWNDKQKGCPFILQSQTGVNKANYYEQNNLNMGNTYMTDSTLVRDDNSDIVLRSPWDSNIIETCHFVRKTHQYRECPDSGDPKNDFFQVIIPNFPLSPGVNDLAVFCKRKGDTRVQPIFEATGYKPSWVLDRSTNSWIFEVVPS
ncbi:hypothetical protein BCR37DRAFT_161267 [Protomyces lactucae-debilis]|uniref:Uncharacterized protein n=1 Tax=Protomyces lactucae-debilis TaxID=2754530 RepID=A0A1Y2EYC1_PROLT|nr:uncharacterized protein BCR37DRAFT_161267 [Protomyces lactucae-debilis]ORY76593.1 hypothetical protein BCR37DRAFT_161267 [Protomyces lactucae-debilis]